MTVSAACGADTATQEPVRDAAQPAAEPGPSPVVPDNPVDRRIRRDLNLAIAGDEELRHREIGVHVVNGDVSVTGLVGSEDERKKVNEIAMNIAGVRSVANALRVAE